MSKTLNPQTEPSVTCGFYNRLATDAPKARMYDAVQMGSIFDGVIADGVFSTIGDSLAVTSSSGNTVLVGTGKCWFNHTWTVNDAPLPIDCGEPDVLLSRYDAIVVEINSEESVRDNSIKVVHGTAASNPSKPIMIHTESINQYALAYILRNPGKSIEEDVKTSTIINHVIGTTETPFVTGILEQVKADVFLANWTTQLNNYIADRKKEIDEFKSSTTNDIEQFKIDTIADFNAWYNTVKQDIEDVANEFEVWTQAEKDLILAWFEDMKGQLSTDAATNLQMQTYANEIKDMLIHGINNGSKSISEDGRTIIEFSPFMPAASSIERFVLKKTFSEDFLECNIELRYGTGSAAGILANGSIIGTLTKHFREDGTGVTTELWTMFDGIVEVQSYESFAIESALNTEV